MERIFEILFGLIMVLAVTCSFSVSEADRNDVHKMLAAALGCNLAWGVIDAVFYCMARFSEQGEGIIALQALRGTADPSEAQIIIGNALPPLLAVALTSAEFEMIRYRLNQMPEPPDSPRFTSDDWLASLGVFLLIFLSTFPVVIPFLIIRSVHLAVRMSNGVAILMLFLIGCAFGRYTGHPRWLAGLAMVILGGALVGITIALGG
jgi:VIT1/CCC1 family predicted Fe2+/Mn2+ transporter